MKNIPFLNNSLKALKSFLPNEKKALNEVLESFITSTKENLENLNRAVSAENFIEIKNIAHKMGPMFKQIQANEISTILDQLELDDFIIDLIKIHSENLKDKIDSLFTLLQKELD